MFKKLKTIKKIAIVVIVVFVTFIICSNVFLIITNIRLDQKLDKLTKGLDEYCENIGYDLD